MGATLKTVYDFLLIGQGLAGTLLAHFLRQDGCSVALIDDAQPRAASRVAAGLINPVTGRRFVKSWRIDELLPFARHTYRSLETQLGVPLYHERPIIRALYSVEEENLWLERCADPGYQDFIAESADLGAFQGCVEPAHAFGLVKGGAQVELGALIDALRTKWVEEDCLIGDPLDFSKLEILKSEVRYGSVRARRVVCCEGRWGKHNPLFSNLPLTGDKGEALIVRFSQGIRFHAILKHKVFVVPLENGHCWIGSNYTSRYDDDMPTAQGRAWLEENLRCTLNLTFETLEHRAAIRPTVRDRRPLMGRHPSYSNLYVFNGLGTKGASLGPFWARHFADYLQGRLPMHADVDIRRF